MFLRDSQSLPKNTSNTEKCIYKMKFHNIILIIAIFVYSITAFYSSGYFHADEHYQIIEFAKILDGTNTPKDMAWEYREQIRPAIQPLIAYGVFALCKYLKITDAYQLTFFLRLLTAFLSISVIYYFTNSCKNIVAPKYWKVFLVLSYFLWFLPFLNVRFSSETWSGIFLLFSISLILRNYRRVLDYVFIGGLLGLSFLFRYQMSFSVIGLILWLLFVRKEYIHNVGTCILSFLVVVLFGIAIDSWYYGNWTVTLLNYFIVNLVEGKAETFGTSPWYNYVLLIFRYPFFPIGIVLLLSFMIVTIKRHKSIIVWVILPFFIGHSFISHKELRFMFPIINLMPLLIISALEVVSFIHWSSIAKKLSVAILFILVSINMICLVIAGLKPAGAGRDRIMREIHDLNNLEQLDVIYSKANNPYSPWGITTNFYKENNATFISTDSVSNTKMHESNKRIVLVFTQADSCDPKIKRIIADLDLKERCKSVPEFMIPFLRIYGYNIDDIIIVYSKV